MRVVKTNSTKGALALLLLAGAVPASPPVQADPARGLEIAHTMKERDRGFGNYTAELEMVLVDAHGKETLRKLHVKTLEIAGDGDESVAIFEAPADVKGTAFLTHTHATRSDDQWLYLPSLKRVKRIAPANRTAPFMGSEFAYEDLASQEVEKYNYDFLGEDSYAGRPTYKIVRISRDPQSGYSRQVVWVDQERYVALKTEYFDRRNQKLKTLLADDYAQYLGRHWRAGTMRMENHRTGKSTVLYWKDYRFRQDLEARDFEPSSLTRQR